jgi:hypothetical protein
MSKLRLKISLSLDGFVAGPDQSVVRTVAAPNVTHLKLARR